MNKHKIIRKNRVTNGAESGFTVLEVAVASVITVISLISLASLFSLSITQNRMVKQFTASTTLAQQKMEELNAIDRNDARLQVGGSLPPAALQDNYWEDICVGVSGTVDTPPQPGQIANYRRFWQVAADPLLANTRVITVRVVALQASRGTRAEGTTLVSVRSW